MIIQIAFNRILLSTTSTLCNLSSCPRHVFCDNETNNVVLHKLFRPCSSLALLVIDTHVALVQYSLSSLPLSLPSAIHDFAHLFFTHLPPSKENWECNSQQEEEAEEENSGTWPWEIRQLSIGAYVKTRETRQTKRKEQLLVVLRNEQVSLSNTEVLQLGQKLSVDLLGIVIYDILNMDNIHIDHIRM